MGSQLRARIWPVGSPEPTTWTIQYTDTNFQTQNNIGATLYNHSTAADWDDIQVRWLLDSEPTISTLLETAPWWDNAWNTRHQLTIQNQSAAENLPARYSAQLTFDTSALVGAGRILPTCDDVRMVFFDGIAQTELDRLVEDCNTDHTRVWFSLQRLIGAGGHDDRYYLYYGNASAGLPPSDGMHVFLFYEDWEQGTSHWTNAGGLDPANTGTMGLTVISPLDFVSPINSQQFPVKRGGGDAFSGYIPVNPSTGYAISVWGKSAANTYGPVGIDPYTFDYVKGIEVWLWTNEWTIGPAWSWRSGQFTTLSSTTYIKIKSEWWAEAPGDQPVYMDNLALRYKIAADPTTSLGTEETTLAVPVISNVQSNSPINLGSPVDVTAGVATTNGTIDTVTLRLISPVSIDIPMSLVSGTDMDGTWGGSYIPTQGGQFSYRILAHATTGLSTLSPLNTFDVIDSQPPQISQLTFTDPLLVRSTQMVNVTVTDNGQVTSVNITIGGISHPMTQNGSQYSYSWVVTTVGDIAFTVNATDSSGNQAQLTDSFTSMPRDVDVCTWKGCKVGAESFSNDDGSNACRDVLEANGLRGTYYYNGASTQGWFATYAAAGHEIASHTVNHPCNVPCCSPNCTPETLNQCPFTDTDVTAYRRDELEPNIAAIEAGSGQPVLSLAWPCGCTDPGRMQAASSYYIGARGYYDYIANLTWLQDVNQPTPVNFYNLNTANAYDQTIIDRAAAEGTWAVVTSHGSCTGIDYMAARQDVLWAAPVGEVLKYIYVRDHTQFSNYSRVGRTISFDAAHTLNPFQRQKLDGTFLTPITFDNPVTLKVHILAPDNVQSVEVDGVSIPFTIRTLDGERYVLIDTPLGTTNRHIQVNLSAPAPTIQQVTDNSPVEYGQQAQVTAIVTVGEGVVGSVNLEVLSPVPATYPMSLAEGTTDTYIASFTPNQLTNFTYRVTAANGEGATSQSDVHTLQVVDTTSPSWRNQIQLFDSIPIGGSNTLSAEGMDIGALDVAILSTDESGAWQEFNWPVSDWWDHAWTHRIPVVVTESSGVARNTKMVDILVSSDQFTGLSSCAAELRVADTARQELPVQIYGESTAGGVRTCHLLFQASVPANDSRTFYIYFGNPLATPPSYATDLVNSTAFGLMTIQNSYFNLDIDIDGGVISRIRLPQGNNANLALSSESNRYWGWHQVCSSTDGNITGLDSQCVGGSAPATGLSLQTTIDGPLMKEFTFTSVKALTTYTISYRFFAGSPYYGYQLGRQGSNPNVMNNFWYANGNFSLLGNGVGGNPSTTYNTYSNGIDNIRIASLLPVSVASIDGLDNDGTDLGGSDYINPTASGLDLWVATANSQTGMDAILGALTFPLNAQLGALEDAPLGQYGSPAIMNGATTWSPAQFIWQNPAIPAGAHIQWRIKFCDRSGNCIWTDVKEFFKYRRASCAKRQL